jgi:hypothetical protein
LKLQQKWNVTYFHDKYFYLIFENFLTYLFYFFSIFFRIIFVSCETHGWPRPLKNPILTRIWFEISQNYPSNQSNSDRPTRAHPWPVTHHYPWTDRVWTRPDHTDPSHCQVSTRNLKWSNTRWLDNRPDTTQNPKWSYTRWLNNRPDPTWYDPITDPTRPDMTR